MMCVILIKNEVFLNCSYMKFNAITNNAININKIFDTLIDFKEYKMNNKITKFQFGYKRKYDKIPITMAIESILENINYQCAWLYYPSSSIILYTNSNIKNEFIIETRNISRIFTTGKKLTTTLSDHC